MSDYISREALLKDIDQLYLRGKLTLKETINGIPAADVRPVVHCRDCKHWRDEYVKQNDGTERQYTDDDTDALGVRHSVSVEVGINMGSMCRYEDDRGWREDKSVFRRGDDFCSRGELRPCSYEKWWGIVNGVYPNCGADMRGEQDGRLNKQTGGD